MQKRKKPKKEWSPNGYLFAAFRKIWRWSPERKRAIENASDIGADGERFKCASCAGRFERLSIAVDHKEPVIVPSKGFEGWDVYYSRLFVPAGNLQILCLKCHKKKTAAEAKLRRQRKKAA